MSPVDLRAALAAAVTRLTQAGVPSPWADAVALAAHAGGTTSAEIRRRVVLGGPSPDGLEALVAERARRVPLQHLTGRVAFRRIELDVGPGVFVPRPESEVVAGLAVAEAARVAATGREPLVVDLCTGSGAIALAVADEVPSARVEAVEIDPLAHAWAARNVAVLQPGGRVWLHLADATLPLADVPDLDGTVDVVTANPPYVPDDAVPVDPEVRDHDPPVALYGGPDGLGIPRAVVARAAVLLRPGGLLVLEHGEIQADEVAAMLTGMGLVGVAGHDDLTRRPRATSGRAP